MSTVATGVFPTGLAVDPLGNVYIADYSHNRVVKLVAATGAQFSMGTGLNQPTGVALDSSGNLYIADNLNSRVVEISAGGGAQTTVAGGLYVPRRGRRCSGEPDYRNRGRNRRDPGR